MTVTTSTFVSIVNEKDNCMPEIIQTFAVQIFDSSEFFNTKG